MWNKTNSTWKKEDNFLNTDLFERFLEKLKTYSKCINASAYSVTNTLEDVYNIIKYQHAFWVQITNIGPDILELENITLNKGVLYNLAETLTTDQINDDNLLRYYLKEDVAFLKAANSLLFEDDNDDFFQTYEPVIAPIFDEYSTSGLSGTSSTSFIVQIQTGEEIVWLNGTNGIYGSDFEFLLIRDDFKDINWRNVFQKSIVDYGYTQKNVFTSEKTFQRLLKNYNIIDVATIEHIDIFDINNNPISFVALDIDNVRIVENHRVLFKNQIDATQNGVYRFENNIFVKDTLLLEEDDFYYFSVFIKEGLENNEKEFFLKKNNDGSYPTINDELFFEEGNNYVLRNRSSYKLLADHVFNSSDYFTQYEPITNINFNQGTFIEGTNGDLFSSELFYTITQDLKYFQAFSDGELVVEIPADDGAYFHPRVVNSNFVLFYIQILNGVSTLKNANVIDVLSSITQTIKTLQGVVRSFSIINSGLMYYISDDINDNRSLYFDNIGLSSYTQFDINQDAQEVSVVRNTSFSTVDDYIFYTTSKSIYLKFNNVDYLILNVNNANRLRSQLIDNVLTISWLENDIPNRYDINISQLNNLLSWSKDVDYELDFFSKTKIGDWEIISNDLYLKDIKITNLGTNSFINIPRISNGPRLYDGLDDYSTIPLTTFDRIKNGTGSFTIDFNVNPNNLRINQPVFYFGDTSQLISFKFRLFNFSFQLPPINYITFYVNNTDDFPYFVLAQGGKVLNIKSNKKLTINTETAVSFTWSYTTNKAIGTLYFDGIMVNSIIDQRVNTTGITNIPLDVRNITYENAFFGKSEFTTSPLYEGTISEFKIWDIALNSSQVLTRKSKSIISSDILYQNLIAYWKLNDFNSVHIDVISNNNGIFFGGLNLDNLLIEIQQPKQIQLNDTYLYILDEKNNESTTSGFGLDDIDFFINDISSTITQDPYDENNTVSLLTTGQFGASIKENVKGGDIISANIDTLYFADTSGTAGIFSGGLLVVNVQDLSGNFLKRYGNVNVEWFAKVSTNANNWNTLTFEYTVPNDLTYDGTNFVLEDDIQVQILLWTSPSREDTYYDNWYTNINRFNPKADLYRVILFNEKIEKFYSTLDGIKSIYLENDNLYFLEDNDIYLWNNTLSNKEAIYSNTTSFINDIVDFTITNNEPYIYRNDFIHDKNDTVIYISTFDNLHLLYSKYQTNINKLNIYWQELNGNINLLSDDYSNINSTSGLILDYIATYPFIDNTILNINSDNYQIINNRVIKNGIIDLDNNNNLWSINLKEIFGIYARGNRLLIGVKTVLNQIQLWMYDPETENKIRFSDNNINSTLFISTLKVDMSYNIIGNDEFLTFIDSDDNRVLMFKIENDNKLNVNFLPFEFSYISTNSTTEIQFFSDTKYWLLLNNNDQLYLSTLNNKSNNYNLFERNMSFVETTKGWITGESGLLFNDDFLNTWELNYNNIIFKDDFNDLEVIKQNVDRKLGYKVKEWSNKSIIVGNRGRIIRSYDNGTNFEVLETNILSDLTSVSFINETDGLIVGLNNTILSTFSSGDSFINVKLPTTIGFRSWTQVIYYKPDNAILIGTNGTIVHLIRNGQIWKTSKILNDLKLTELQIQIKQENLDDFINLEYRIDFDSDIYNGTINSICHLKDNDFLICGDNDMIGYLRLIPKLGYFEPVLNFYSTDIKLDWKQIVSYKDFMRNQNRAFLLSDKKIYSFEWDRFVLDKSTNIQLVELELFYEHDKNLKHINFWKDNYLISVGERVDVIRHTLYDTIKIENSANTSGTSFIDLYVNDFSIEKQDLKNFFTPKLLFLDYYMGRKINIHLEDGSFEKPTTNIPKNLLECFYFRNGESITFSDYGTVDNQPNFLAYQDYYYLNRRLLDGGINKWGKMQNPYNKYNKTITAINNYNETAIWEANSCNGIFENNASSGIVCVENLLEEGDFSKNGINWTQDNSVGIDSWVFTSNKARVSKSEAFGPSGSYILKQNSLIFKNIKHKFKFDITNSGGNYDINIYGYKGSSKFFIASKTNPSPSDFIEFTTIEDFTAFGISITYQGLFLQTISLDNLVLEKDDVAFSMFNDNVTDPSTYISGDLFEESKATKIQIDPSTFKVNKDDVIRIVVTQLDKTKLVKENDTIFYKIQNEALNTFEKAIVTNDQLNFEFFSIDSIEKFNKTVQDIEDEILIKSAEISNQYLKERCLKTLKESRKLIVDDINEYTTNNNIKDGIYIEATNKIYLPVYDGDNKLLIIDAVSRVVINNINLTDDYKKITYNENNNLLYLANDSGGSNDILVIDITTETILTNINTGGLNVNGISYNKTNKYIYATTNSGLLIINNLTIIENIINVLGINDIFSKGIIHNENFTYVKKNVFGDEKIHVISGTNFIQDIVIPTTINTLISDMIYIESTEKLYVTTNNDNTISIIDTNSNIVTNTIDVGENVSFIEYVPNKNRLYISNTDFSGNENMTIFDINTESVISIEDVDIDVRTIKYNSFEDVVYLGSNNGELKIFDPNNEVLLALDEKIILDGNINYLLYGNNTIYPLIYDTKHIYVLISEISYGPTLISEISKLIVDQTCIVREYNNTTQTITLWDVWDDELVEETKNGRIILQNLNYFNGDLIHLEKIFKEHLLGQSYVLNVRTEDNIIIDGYVNDYTKYYNLESFITLNVYGGTNSTSSILQNLNFPIKYSDDVVYGPNYSLMSFLTNINSTAFYPEYTFDMPEHTFTYNTLKRTGLGEYIEFSIIGSRIFVGEELTDILDFEDGIFIDIITNTKVLYRVHINSITETYYEKYPTVKRYIIQTDHQLDQILTLNGQITLRSRNSLDEISKDLEFTDNVMFPIPNGSTSGHSVEYQYRSYFQQTRTAAKYAKIILNDDKIRKYITAAVFVDDKADWNLNVIDWKSDPNFFYRPVEIHEVGVDKVLKKAISVDSSNYLVSGEQLSLINIDFEKFNYRLIDLLTVKELEKNYTWVLNAEIRDAIIGQNSNGELVWYQGDWLCGTWEDGIWHSGRAFNIEWNNGVVNANKINNNYNLIEVVADDDPNNTIWFNAFWVQGTWNNGVWFNGIWNSGIRFNGIWNNGTWINGIWEDGIFNGGIWKDGIWLAGEFSEENSVAIWENGTWLGGDFSNGLWLNGIWDQTDRVASRFGTKASLLHKAIWEYGLWKNGEFHSGLTTDSNNIPIASTTYSNSIWKNGIWEKGNFYGGIWEMGRWNNGKWYNGIWDSKLDIKELRYKEKELLDTNSLIEVEFTTKHYFKNINNQTNYFIILGKPEITLGEIHPNTELLGYNMNPIRHEIISIVDDYTIQIIIDDILFPYPENASDATSGTSALDLSLPTFLTTHISTGLDVPTDIVYVPINDGKLYVPHSVSNRVATVDINSNSVSTVSGSTPNINNIFWNNIVDEIYIPNTLSNTITVIDVTTDIVIDTIIVENSPLNIEFVPINNKAYSTNPNDNSVSDINIISRTSTRISTGVSTQPHSILLANTNELFISCTGTDQIKVLNSITNTITNTINVSDQPTIMALDITNNNIYVVDKSGGLDKLSVINATTKNYITSINIGVSINNIKYVSQTNNIYLSTTNGVYIIDTNSFIVNNIILSGINISDIEYYPDFKYIMCLNNDDNNVIPLDITNNHSIVSDDIVETEEKPIKIIYVEENETVWVINNNSNSLTKIQKFDADLYDLQNCVKCKDYTLLVVDIKQYNNIKFNILNYIGKPEIASNWLNGTFNQGIWKFGWFNNGTWTGGIWLNGVFENGKFGS